MHPITAIVESHHDLLLHRFDDRVDAQGCLDVQPAFRESARQWMTGFLHAFRADLESLGNEAVAAHVAAEVRTHRSRGVPLAILVGCAQAARDAVREVIAAADPARALPAEALARAMASLDKMTLEACRVWEELDPDSRVARHRAAAREEADERERYQNLVDGLPATVLVLDGQGQIVLGNRPAAQLCGSSVYGWRRPGTKQAMVDVLPELAVDVEAFLASGVEESSMERDVRIDGAPRHLQVRMRRRGDGPQGRAGAVIMFSELTVLGRADDDPSTFRDAIGRRVRENSDEVLRLSASLLAEAEGRTRSEQDYRLTASKLEAVFSVVPDLFFHMDLEGRFKEYLTGHQELLSFPRVEFMGRKVSEVMPEPVGTMILQGIRRAAETRTVVMIEYALPQADGEHYFEARLVAISGDDVVAIVRDQTDRRRAERVLEESEERYRLLVDLAPDGIAVHQDGRIVFANQAALRLFGARKPEDLIGRPIMEVVHPDWRERARQNVVRMLTEGAPLPLMEERFLRMDGTAAEVEVAAGPTKYQGRPAIQVVVRDVSERKRAAENYRSIVDSAVEGIYQCTVEGKVFSANPALARILGYDGIPAMCADRACDALRLHGGAARWAEFLRAVETGDAVCGFEFESTRIDGRSIWLSENARCIRNDEGHISRIIGMVEDITERRDLEQRLRHAQKMEAVGRLAGGIAHDFNNLLTAITGYSALLLDEIGRDSPLRPKVDEILGAGRRAAALTGQLLVFSRRQVLHPALLDLNSVANGMDSLLRRLLGENVRLVRSPRASLGAVRADEGQIEQVIMNLVVNARDAMPDGGTIVLSTDELVIPPGGDPAHVGIPPGTWVRMSVGDNGSGMDPETCSHVFEPFFTTKGPGKGTGLGLAVVYGIVQQSGGRIIVDSEPGRGSIFHVYLPRIEGVVAPHAIRPEPKAAGGSETVLVAEDEDAVRGFTVAVLTERGYRVLEARDGHEALEVAARFGHAIDLLVTDVVMPGMNGRDLARRLLALRPTMRVVFTSGYTDGDAAFLGLAETGSVFLPKPFLPDALAGVVRAQLGRPN